MSTPARPASGRGSATSRRSVLAAGAWAAPAVVMASAAPAFAASPCSTDFAYGVDWGTSAFSRASAASATATATSTGAGATPLAVTFSSVMTGAAVVRDTALNLTVPATTNIGGLGGQALVIRHSTSGVGRGNRQDLTVNFGRPVSNLVFSITDIDSSTDSWYDRVELSGARTAVQAAGVIGNGTNTAETTTTGPWRQSGANANLGDTDAAGNVRVTFAGPVSSFVLTFWNSVGTAAQRIYLTDFAFTAKGC
jgi:hypothetical protein